MNSVLQQLLRGVSRADFFAEHFLRLPFSMPGGCEHLCGFADWKTIDRVLSKPDADLIVGRKGEQRSERPTSASAAKALLSDGFTLGIRHAEKHDPPLADLATQFREEFLAPVDIHLYATPAGQPGFGWHYDAEDVFVLQCQGSKEWELRKNTVNPWPLIETLPADMRHEREIMPVMRCSLAAGDWLYIPSGYWHRTRAGEESISLSVGLLSATALDLFDFLRTRLVDSLLWRQRLPSTSGRSPEESAEALHPLLESLGDDLRKIMSQKEFGDAFCAFRQSQTADSRDRP